MGKATTPITYPTETLVTSNCTIVLHRPELTEDVRAKREAELSKALNRYALHLAEQDAQREGVCH